MTVKERLVAFMQHKKIGQRKFEMAVGLSNGYVNSLRNAPGADKLQMIINTFPELNINWLLTGEGEMLKSRPESNAREVGGVYSASMGDPDVVEVDFVPVAAHASFIENLTVPDGDFNKISLIAKQSEKAEIDKYKVFEVDGDSMYPSIKDGALILTKEIPERSWHYAEGVIVAVYDEYVVVKRVLKNDLLSGNILVLGSDNAKYGTVSVQLADIRALYKAKRIISSDII
ncbi:MAG: hypothetical protein NC043_06945 [Muribaculaceae bacterium]|nr:hypothetical protein [Muribaculaceae bacterium]